MAKRQKEAGSKRKKYHSSSIKSNEACLFFPFSIAPRSRACRGLNRVSRVFFFFWGFVLVCGLLCIGPVCQLMGMEKWSREDVVNLALVIVMSVPLGEPSQAVKC